LVDDAIVC